MYESATPRSGTTGASGKIKIDALHEAERRTLFSFTQKGLDIRLTIGERIANVQVNAANRTVRGALARREVEFLFLATQFDDDFEAVSKLLSLITAAERNQFGEGHTEMRMGCLAYSGGTEFHSEIFVRRVQFKNKGYGLTLGIDAEFIRNSADLPIFWVHHLKHGLQKALNWMKPLSGLDAWRAF